MRSAPIALLCVALAATACSSSPELAQREPVDDGTETPAGSPTENLAQPPDPTAEPEAPTSPPAAPTEVPELTAEESRRVHVLLAATLQPGDAPDGFRFLTASNGPGQCVRGAEGWIAYESIEGGPLTQRHIALPGFDDTETALAAFRDCGGLSEQVVQVDDETGLVFTQRESDFRDASWQITTAYYYQGGVLTQVEGAVMIGQESTPSIFEITSDLLLLSRDRINTFDAGEPPFARSPEQFEAAVLSPSEAPEGVIQLQVRPSSSDLLECLDGYYRYVNQGSPVVVYGTADDLFFGQASVTVRPDTTDLAAAVEFFDTVCLEPAEGSFVRGTETMVGNTLLAVNREIATGSIFITAYQFGDGILTFALAEGAGSEVLEAAMVNVVALSAAKVATTAPQ